MIFGNLCKCLRDQHSRLLSSLLVRDRNRRLIGVAGKRLRWLSLSAIEQCIRRRNASVRSVAFAHFLDQALDRLSRVTPSEFSDFGNAAGTAAGIAGLPWSPLPVRLARCHAI